MTTINPHFTFVYSQPDEYHYSHDSVFVARRVFENLREQHIEEFEVLDLCAGCGIIGLDFLSHCRKELNRIPKRCDFVEVQSIYESHFRKNAENFPAERTRFLNLNYASLATDSSAAKYDLILCNPPYFHLGHGTLSPSEFKNRCRYYIDSDFKTLMAAIENSLKPEGKAFVLIPELEDHGLDPLEEVPTTLKTERLEDIRGTRFVLITKQLRKCE